MDKEQIKQRLIVGVGGDAIRKLRFQTATTVGKMFEAIGSMIPATHVWRTWDQVNTYSKTFPDIEPIFVAAISKIYPVFRKWGEADPIYATMVEHAPEQ